MASSPRSLTTSVAPNSFQCDPVGVAAHDDDLLRAEPLRRDHSAQTDSAVADDRDRAARTHPRGDRGVMAGAHHVGQRQERGHERIVFCDIERVERAVGIGDPKRLGLGAVELAAGSEETDVDAGRRQPFLAEQAGAVGVGERHDGRAHPMPPP